MNPFNQLFFCVLVITCGISLSKEVMSTVSSEVGDVPTFFPHSNLIGKRRSAQENHTSLIEKDDLKVVNIKLQELSYHSIIKSELDEHGHEYLSLFSNSRAQKNETIVLFSNYDRLNLSSQVRSNLKTEGEKLKFLDLSTFDADTSEMNLLFSATNRLRWLIMPIQGKFNINEIIFPKNIEGLVIYNQRLSNDNIAAICKMNKLSHLIFWGCDLIDSKTNNPLPAGLKLQVEDLTLINPGAKLNHFFKFIEVVNLASITVDDYDLFRRFLDVGSLKLMVYHSYRFSTDVNFPIVRLLEKDLKNLRSSDFPPIEVRVVRLPNSVSPTNE